MRKAKPKKRVILPDPVFNDVKVSKFVNHLMYDGKKNTSYEIFYAALETVKAKMQNEEMSALEIWKKALDNVNLEIRDGEFLAVIGHTGSGKSTLLNILRSVLIVRSLFL